ncbi:voltage-gated potassium channel [Aureococcus anophagefferens]|nr:voltage-gated potassium channel [Aureococcus anophagefferens]
MVIKWTPSVQAEAEAEALAASSSETTTVVRLEDWLNFPSVCKWIEKYLDYDNCENADETVLVQYLPTRMEFKLKEELVKKSVGAQALTGHVAFNLAAYSGGPNTILASWMVIADYYGNIKTIEPVEYEGDLYRIFALKITGSLDTLITKTFDIHDIQRAHEGTDIWTLGADLTYQELSVAKNGKEIMSNDLSKTTTIADPNHFQLIDDDAYAIVSARLNNAIYKIHVETGKAEWILGGADGEFFMYGPDGQTYVAGDSYWYGQHNAEYFGDNEFLMFDNNYDEELVDASRNSRLLAVKIDDVSMTANITFQYDLDTYSNIFGDNDRLPTANLLACYWPSDTMDFDNQFSAKIIELDRSTSETAFELKIVNQEMTSAECEHDVCRIQDGFFMYSLTFTTHNTYKQSAKYAGVAHVYDEKGVLQTTQTFAFAAFWREASVTVTGVTAKGTVVVANAHGTSRTVSFS